jgi:hypothetical protein
MGRCLSAVVKANQFSMPIRPPTPYGHYAFILNG